MTRSTRLSVAIAIVVGLVLSGCDWLGIRGPGPLSGGDIYVGEDAATITVTTEQVGCCYIEGSLRFVRLDGPSSLDWAVDDGSGSGSPAEDRYVVGVQRTSVKPGDYTLTAWERSCSGNCDNLDPPGNYCAIDFAAAPGDTIDILVSFTIPEPCVATRQQH
jgi:hypothetical protein